MSAHVHVVGFGTGPDHLTREAVRALLDTDYVLAVRKQEDDDLLRVRRAICEEFEVELVEVPDPQRDRDDPTDYPAAVRDWHAARVAAFADMVAARGGRATFLVWGDPSLYDSTLRVVEGLAADRRLAGLTWDVVPGISAPQLLAARHRVVLHPIGAPVHVTTARRLRDTIDEGQRNVLVMLGSEASLDLLEKLPGWTIWWGANLGSAGEELVAGPVRDVLPQVRAARARARELAGWVMDVYLLRDPEGDV